MCHRVVFILRPSRYRKLRGNESGNAKPRNAWKFPRALFITISKKKRYATLHWRNKSDYMAWRTPIITRYDGDISLCDVPHGQFMTTLEWLIEDCLVKSVYHVYTDNFTYISWFKTLVTNHYISREFRSDAYIFEEKTHPSLRNLFFSLYGYISLREFRKFPHKHPCFRKTVCS